MSSGTQDETSTTTEGTIDYDDCFDLLSNHRRRYTLHYLKQNGEDAKLGELSEQIAAWENDVPREEVSYDQRKRVYTSLQQVHLPRMDDLGVIEFDDRDGVATLSSAAGEVDIYLETVDGSDVPWSTFYLLLVLANSVVVAGGLLDVPPFGLLPSNGLAIFVLTTFLVVSLAHVYVTRTEMRLGGKETPPELSP